MCDRSFCHIFKKLTLELRWPSSTPTNGEQRNSHIQVSDTKTKRTLPSANQKKFSKQLREAMQDATRNTYCTYSNG